MKYYIAPSQTVQQGPGGDQITMTGAALEVSKKTFTKTLNRFINNADATQQKKEETRALAWKTLHAGETVTIKNKTLFIKTNPTV